MPIYLSTSILCIFSKSESFLAKAVFPVPGVPETAITAFLGVLWGFCLMGEYLFKKVDKGLCGNSEPCSDYCLRQGKPDLLFISPAAEAQKLHKRMGAEILVVQLEDYFLPSRRQAQGPGIKDDVLLMGQQNALLPEAVAFQLCTDDLTEHCLRAFLLAIDERGGIALLQRDDLAEIFHGLLARTMGSPGVCYQVCVFLSGDLLCSDEDGIPPIIWCLKRGI